MNPNVIIDSSLVVVSDSKINGYLQTANINDIDDYVKQLQELVDRANNSYQNFSSNNTLGYVTNLVNDANNLQISYANFGNIDLTTYSNLISQASSNISNIINSTSVSANNLSNLNANVVSLTTSYNGYTNSLNNANANINSMLTYISNNPSKFVSNSIPNVAINSNSQTWTVNSAFNIYGNLTVSNYANSSIQLNYLSSSSTTQLYINADGSLQRASSDIRLKENIVTVQNGTSIVRQLNPVSFTWNNNNQNDIGFIAQDIQKINPSLVYLNSDGYYGFDQVKLIPYLVKTVQELSERVKELKAKRSIV